MGNREDSKIRKILKAVRSLPLFTLDDLASIETDKTYLKILLSRHEKAERVIRLKKGTYVTRAYVDTLEKSGRMPAYAEFLAGALYAPSYLSTDYILHRHGILTESPAAVTSVSKKKTIAFTTSFGTYRYQSIAPALFSGFETERDGDFFIFRARLGKALFDFLYFRKRHLVHPRAVEELRLNIGEVGTEARRECIELAAQVGSARMQNIMQALWKK